MLMNLVCKFMVYVITYLKNRLIELFTLESCHIPPKIYDFIHNGSKNMNNEIKIYIFIDLVKYILTIMKLIHESSKQ